MVVAAANLVTKHGIDNIDLDNDYIGSDHNFLHDGTSRRKRRHDDDIISMGHDDADAEGMLKVLYLIYNSSALIQNLYSTTLLIHFT